MQVFSIALLLVWPFKICIGEIYLNFVKEKLLLLIAFIISVQSVYKYVLSES